MPDAHPPPSPSKDRSFAARVQTGALVIIAFAVVLALLVQAQFILISLAVSVILFSLTSDAIALVARVRFGPVKIPNWLASSLALLLLAIVLLSLAAVIVSQVNTVLLTALSYSEQAPAAVAAIFSLARQGTPRRRCSPRSGPSRSRAICAPSPLRRAR